MGTNRSPMATTTRRRRIVKSTKSQGGVEVVTAEGAVEVVRDQLEALACRGARLMLMGAMDDELDAYLGRGRYERSGEFRGYRNGSTPRRLTLGSGTVVFDSDFGN